MQLRSAALLALFALAMTAAAASAAPRVTAGMSPSLVHQGEKTTLAVRVRTGTRSCSATLHFSNGQRQTLAPKRPRSGHVTFVAAIAGDAAVGEGRWAVSCNTGAVTTGTFVVVRSKSTAGDTTPRVVVQKQGFSQRPDSHNTTTSELSFGVVLQNTSETDDAENVYVIVNMVAADGQLIASVAKTIPLVSAGSTFGYGDSMHLRTQVPATALEITIRVAAHEPKKVRVSPDLANVRIVPSQFDPGFVGEVDGELVNDNSPLTLQTAKISIVVLDASGTPIGGGTGYSTAALPPNSRFVFLAQQGFNPIPLGQAASVLISTTPTYGPAI